MPLPVSPNAISLNQVNVELLKTGSTNITLNNTDVRTLFNKPTALSTISMSDGHGKSNRKTITHVFSANADRPSLNLGAIAGYVAGISDIYITVNSGVYLYSTTTATAALRLTGGTAGDLVYLINNGYIMGQGGIGGGSTGATTFNAPGAGGAAINSSRKFASITGTGYIGGGGGGGGGGVAGAAQSGGGGGAGGGAGGWAALAATAPATWGAGGAGGGLNASGANGQPGDPNAAATRAGTGGGGGRIMPGSGGAYGSHTGTVGGYGGGAGGGASTYTYSGSNSGGGGGGWGATGGTYVAGSITTFVANGGSGGNVGGTSTYTGSPTLNFGAVGGAAIQTNSQGIGPVSCTLYGAIV